MLLIVYHLVQLLSLLELQVLLVHPLLAVGMLVDFSVKSILFDPIRIHRFIYLHPLRNFLLRLEVQLHALLLLEHLLSLALGLLLLHV